MTNIKKSLYFLVLLTSFFSMQIVLAANGIIQLPVPNGGHMSNNGQPLVISLSGTLTNNVPYNVICHVNKLTYHSDVSSKGVYCTDPKKDNPTRICPPTVLINGFPASKSLEQYNYDGDNIVELPMFKLINTDPTGALIFQINDAATTITSCVAIPV